MPNILRLTLLIVFPFLLHGQTDPFEEGNDTEFFVLLDSFAVYGGEIKVIDGMTGEKYTIGNEVVMDFHYNMPKIMGGFHTMLLDFEAEYLKQRFTDGLLHEKELKGLAHSFGIKGFDLDKEQLFRKERVIINRLRQAPFYHLDELVVWDLARLKEEPDNPYAQHIRFDPDTQTWHRRVIINWDVITRHPHGAVQHAKKSQGLDLDTQSGFYQSSGLHEQVNSGDFKDLKLSYPIFIDSRKPAEAQMDSLKRAFVKNLRHIYDPFSWGGRRDERFRYGLMRELHSHQKGRSHKFKNREWYDQVICQFLNDVAVIRRHGYEVIYEEIAGLATIERYHNQLGEEIDLLNWEADERREIRRPYHKARNPIHPRISFDTARGARYILLDAYLRKGEQFVDTLRTELLAVKKKQDPIPVFESALSKTMGMPAEKYIELAYPQQRQLIGKFYDKALEKKKPQQVARRN
ncbi:hypothetical protein [Pelagicoccus mobilis]|uniref:Uncharacterized protein n=1 Tax=Pelagicoccus mobilis TaxID=415221 RepID=A0A934VTX0_9BACT|nr:hypothetical protein [Pelagicoccus mobilis]MBK1880505.1 hypothetical protein [Pelagicoccus mobilis]